jgi:phosphatidate cytidylyltransferase
MLKQRVLTAIVLILTLAGVMYQGSKELFTVFMGIIVFIASWEWAGLCGGTSRYSRLLYSILITGIMFTACFGMQDSQLVGISLLGTLWWCMALILVFSCQSGKRIMPKKRMAKYFIGLFVLLPASLSLISQYNSVAGPYYVLLLFTLIWVVDSPAYFVGKKWGKQRLADRISPGKTREGFVSSMIVAVIPPIVFIFLRSITGIEALFLICLCLVTAGFSVVGDLFESMIKREANRKDSSRLLPGHGGLLDRIDSLTAATPVFVLGLRMIEGN